MLTKIMALAAVSTLALTSAMAQTTSPSSSPGGTASSPPAATSATPAPSASAATPAAGKAAKFVTKQTNAQWLGSKFKGTDVIGANDEKIGDVSDMLFDKDHKIIAYIVGVGGFLGIGQKDVAIDPASFQMVPASASRSGTGTGSTGTGTGGSSSTGSNTGSGTASASNDHDNFKLRLSMTKDELKNAPAFEQYSARPATTSQAPANRPAGGSAPGTPSAPKQ